MNLDYVTRLNRDVDSETSRGPRLRMPARSLSEETWNVPRPIVPFKSINDGLALSASATFGESGSDTAQSCINIDFQPQLEGIPRKVPLDIRLRTSHNRAYDCSYRVEERFRCKKNR